MTTEVKGERRQWCRGFVGRFGVVLPRIIEAYVARQRIVGKPEAMHHAYLVPNVQPEVCRYVILI